MTKLITFITPIYNTKIGKVDKLIESFKGIEDDRVEGIIVDNNSDETFRKEYRNRFKNIVATRYLEPFETDPKIIISQGLQGGLKKANGKYYMRIDSDQEFNTKELDKVIEKLSQTNADLILTNGAYKKYEGKTAKITEFTYFDKFQQNVEIRKNKLVIFEEGKEQKKYSVAPMGHNAIIKTKIAKKINLTKEQPQTRVAIKDDIFSLFLYMRKAKKVMGIPHSPQLYCT